MRAGDEEAAGAGNKGKRDNNKDWDWIIDDNKSKWAKCIEDRANLNINGKQYLLVTFIYFGINI